MSQPAIRAIGIHCTLAGREVLSDVDLEVRFGEVLALVGPNGAGKSTLLSVLSGDRDPDAGEIHYGADPLVTLNQHDRARRRAVLLQHNAVAFSFTAGQVISMGRHPWPADPVTDDLAIAEAVAAADVADLLQRPYGKLSGGEQARVSLARVLAQDTPILLLDEPTASVDLRHEESVFAGAAELAGRGRAVVVVVHDLSLAAAHADRIALMDSGELVSCGAPRDVLTAEAIRRTWHQDVHLLEDPDGVLVITPKRPARRSQKGHQMTVATIGLPLSVQMREGSQAEHTAAESSTFMSELLDLNINERGYAEYLARFVRVYEALETVGHKLADHPVVGQLIDPRLDRSAALAADLAHWAPAGVGEIDSPATDAYVDQIWACADDPLRFVAHHYTRYLGDLSGGQVIGKKLAREFDLVGTAGVDFYEFPEIAKPKPYKDAYRATLDSLEVSEVEKERIVEEVRRVFNLNGAVFEELTANLARYLRK